MTKRKKIYFLLKIVIAFFFLSQTGVASAQFPAGLPGSCQSDQECQQRDSSKPYCHGGLCVQCEEDRHCTEKLGPDWRCEGATQCIKKPVVLPGNTNTGDLPLPTGTLDIPIPTGSMLDSTPPPPPGGFVPCGTKGTRPCNLCDLFKLFKNVIDFGISRAVPLIAFGLFVYAGVLFILSPTGPNNVTKAKTIFRNTSIGVALIFGAWMITNFVLRSLAGDNQVAEQWYKFECRAPIREPGPVRDDPFPNNETQPPGDTGPSNQASLDQVATLANQLKSQSNISFRTTGGCASRFPNSTAQGNITSFANKQYPLVCSSSCDCKAGGSSGTITIRSKILEGLVAMAQSFSSTNIVVTSFTGDSHSVNSTHYQGRSVDLVPQASKDVWQQVVDFLRSKYGGDARCEKNSARVDCRTGGADHIHWQIN